MRLGRKGTALVGTGLVCFILIGIHLCLQKGSPVFSPFLSWDEVLIIDPGHGGSDGGAVSKSGTIESDINLAIAQRLRLLCGLFGVPHTMTRWDENSIHDSDAYTLREQKRSDLKNRVDLINETPNGCLISIHQNIYDGSSSRGAQVFYRNEDSRLWAEETQKFLSSLDEENHRQAAEISDSVYLMKYVTCPAILVECGFLSNSRDEAMLQSEEHQTKLASALLASYLIRQEMEDAQ